MMDSGDLGGYKYLDGKMEGMNIIGLSIGVRGLNLMEVCLDLRHVFTIDGLHHDAVISRLLAGGFSPPLYLHSSFQAYPELKRQILTAASHSGAAGTNITKYVLQLILFSPIYRDVVGSALCLFGILFKTWSRKCAQRGCDCRTLESLYVLGRGGKPNQ